MTTTSASASKSKSLAGALGLQVDRKLVEDTLRHITDEELLDAFRSGLIGEGLAVVEPLGGLRGIELRFPKSFAELRQRLVATFGAHVFDRVYAADARVLAAVRGSLSLEAWLTNAMGRHPASKEEVAHRTLDGHRSLHRFRYRNVFDIYAAADEDRRGEPGPHELGLGADALWGTLYAKPEALADTLEQEALGDQAEADARMEIGKLREPLKIAERERIVPPWNADVVAQAVLPPRAGVADAAQAIALARLAGRAGAVIKRRYLNSDVFFVCALAEDLDYDDVFTLWQCNLVVHGDVPVVAITSNVGHVAVPDGDRVRYVEYGLEDASSYLRAQAAIAETAARQSAARPPPSPHRPDVPIVALFGNMVLDLALLKLDSAEQWLREARMAVERDPARAGERLIELTGNLRPLYFESARWGWAELNRGLSDAEAQQARTVLERIGAILARDRVAGLLVEIDRDPDDEDEPEDDEFEDLLADADDADEAAEIAVAAITKRIENVEKGREYIVSRHPDAAGALGAVHPEVLAVLSDRQQRELGISGVSAALDAIADSLEWTRPEMLLVYVGVIGIAVPPIGAIAAALSIGLGAVQAADEFRDADALSALTAIDVPGGVQLATPQDADSARFWARVSLGLVAWDIAGPGFSRALRARIKRIGKPRAAGLSLPEGSAGAQSVSVAAGEAASVTRSVTRLVRASDDTLRQLSGELKLSKTRIVWELITAADEGARIEVVNRMRAAAAMLLKGARAETLDYSDVLRAGLRVKIAPKDPVKTVLVLGAEHADDFAWGMENVLGRRTVTAAGPSRNAASSFIAAGGEFVQGQVADVPLTRQFHVIREDLRPSVAIPDMDLFTAERLDRLEPGGRWLVVTESDALAIAVLQHAPRPGVRTWSTHVDVPGGGAKRRHAIMITKDRVGRRIAIAKIAPATRPAGYPPAKLDEDLALLRSLRDRVYEELDDMRAAGIVDGQVISGHWNRLKGNIAEILSDGYKRAIRDEIRKTFPGAQIYSGLRMSIPGKPGGEAMKFSDDVIAVADGNDLRILAVFEVKAGPRGGQEAAAQVFEWIEGDLTKGAALILPDKRRFYYKLPPANEPGAGMVVGLANAPRHIVVPRGSEEQARRSAQTVSQPLVRKALPRDAAEISYLGRRMLEEIPTK